MKPLHEIVVGDAREIFRLVRPGVARCCVTSPPYWGLRDYGTAPLVWGGNATHAHDWGEVGAGGVTSGHFCACGAWLGSLGLEPTPDLYVEHLVEIFREVRRVLSNDGTLWLNLGDSHARDAAKGQHRSGDGTAGKHTAVYEKGGGRASAGVSLRETGLKPKDLVGIPWMVAFALRADGWYLRSDVVWDKPNPMPESVRDRPTRSHEYVFLFSKSKDYYYDVDAIREPFADGRDGSKKQSERNRGGREDGYTKPNGIDPSANGGKNARSVWRIAPTPHKAAHFALMPIPLAEKCLLAGSSAMGKCVSCGMPQERVVEKVGDVPATERRQHFAEQSAEAGIRLTMGGGTEKSTLGAGAGGDVPMRQTVTVGWRPTCACNTTFEPDIVIDPFAGGGTTGVAALTNGRHFLGAELNPAYVEIANARIVEAVSGVEVPT